jgi:hypothetical protein
MAALLYKSRAKRKPPESFDSSSRLVGAAAPYGKFLGVATHNLM